MPDLSGKVVVVTGASQGLGAATAAAVAERGAHAVLASRSGDANETEAAAIRSRGGAALALVVDVTNYAEVRIALGRVLTDLGAVSAIVNNAGTIEPIGHLGDTDPAIWRQGVMTNLVGPYNVAHAFLGLGGDLAGRVIVNVSTGAAHAPREGWSAYCAAKAGLSMLTRSLAHEYGEGGLRVFGFVPGLVDTAMQERIRASGMNEISRIPQSQMSPPTIPAAIISYLCGDEAADMAGAELAIDDAELRARAGVPPT